MSFRKKNDEMLQPPPHPQYEIQPMGSRWSIYTNSDNMDDEDRGMVHQSTLMFGRYTKDLSDYAKNEARKLRMLERQRKKEDRNRDKEVFENRSNRCMQLLSRLWQHTFARLGEDWVFLAILGFVMGLISYLMDIGISTCLNARIWMYHEAITDPILSYFAWVTLPVCLVLFAAGLTHLLAPQAAGSGIPEMKTILRGVQLNEFLTFRCLVAKVIGLTAVLGSGMPLGKEGPFVHIASIVGNLLSKMVTSFQAIYVNESRKSEMLAAACAVGVGTCFGAPLGGVLFSIEVTTTYFAVRNYWRGFFACVCGATLFFLMSVLFGNTDTVKALFATSFTSDVVYDPYELFIFTLMGVFAGVLGALFVFVQRNYILFIRGNQRINKFFQINRFLYPLIISLLIATLMFPPFTGQFFGSHLGTHDQFMQLFTNFTWGRDDLTVEEDTIVNNWRSPYSNIYVNLGSYFMFNYIFSIVGSTMPIPCGMFIPMMKIGASYGRLFGEGVHYFFPNGFGNLAIPILPGGYAVVGSAAFSAGVTHSVSVGVILFEITGQIRHIIPVMIAVLVANYVASFLQLSMYDSYIMIKKLPFLPDLLPSCPKMYNICVEHFMVRNVKYIWRNIKFYELKLILKNNKELHSLPIVDRPENMILLGSVNRHDLVRMIERHIGRKRRLEVAAKWRREAKKRAREEADRRIQMEAEEQCRARRPSRFEVIPAPDVQKLRELANNEMLPPQAKKTKETINNNASLHSLPAKSILKKTNSFNSQKGSSPYPLSAGYSTISGTDSRIRSALEAILRKSATLQDITPGLEGNSVGYAQTITGSSPSISKRVQLPSERVIDMSLEEQKIWEHNEMQKTIDLHAANVHIDPSPFQLVERTSLLKVHSMFSMLGINHAYVTQTGRLAGVVALKELREAITNLNNGTLQMHPMDDQITPTIITTSDNEEEMPLPLHKQPLLGNSNDGLDHIQSSTDSVLSNSDNCSVDIEMGNLNTQLK